MAKEPEFSDLAWGRRAPDRWEPSLLSGYHGLIRWFTEPTKAYQIERNQFKNWRAYGRLQELGIIDHFAGYPAVALPPQYDDLFNLYQVVQERRPTVVLELGGGYSTIVIASALKNMGYGGEFWSVDESERWQLLVQQRMPPELRPFVRYHCAPPILRDIAGESVSVFESLPVGTADLVYVDGGLVPGNTVGGDAVLLEEHAPDGFTVLVDGRRNTVAFLRRALKGRYSIGHGPYGVQTLFQRSI